MFEVIAKEAVAVEEAKKKAICIIYTEKGIGKAIKIKNGFKGEGIQYFDLVVSNEGCLTDEIDKCIGICSKAIFIVTDDWYLDSPNVLTKYFFYTLGKFKALGKPYTFLLQENIELNQKMAGILFMINQNTRSTESIVGEYAGEGKDKKVLALPYFSDTLLNKFSYERIKPVKLTVVLRVDLKTCDNIANEIVSLYSNIKDKQESVDSLLNNMKCGCTVIRFGKEDFLKHSAFKPYRPEMEYIFKDFPVAFEANKPKIISKPDKNNDTENKEDGITIKMELILPNHEILGASFKPFFELEADNLLESAKMLFPDYYKSEDGKMIVKGKRIYFTLPLDKKGIINIEGNQDAVDRTGKVCNYIYPK